MKNEYLALKLLNSENTIFIKMKQVISLFHEQITYAWEQRKLSECASFLTGNGLNWNDISDEGNKECILYGNLFTDY